MVGISGEHVYQSAVTERMRQANSALLTDISNEPFTRVSFAEIQDRVPRAPGIYKIYTLDHQPLKVGIAGDLRKRLMQHRDSRQKYLQLKPRGSWANRSDVVSKRSILAKHLFFDRWKDYELETELGRQQFLLKECYVLFLATRTREEAREMERLIEGQGGFRYVGRPSRSGA